MEDGRLARAVGRGRPASIRNTRFAANAKLPVVAPHAYLECTKWGASIDAARPQTVCPKDGGVLYVRYKLAALKPKFTTASLVGRAPTMWRYAEVLPEAAPVSLG